MYQQNDKKNYRRHTCIIKVESVLFRVFSLHSNSSYDGGHEVECLEMASKTKEDVTRQKRDPFAYFGGLGDVDGDDDESESEEDERETKGSDLSFISKSEAGENERIGKLPSAEKILETSTKPEFLNKDAKVDIDWEKYAKDDTKEQEEPVNYSSNAIPPPATYDPVSEPLKPTIGDTAESEDRGNLKRHSTDGRSTRHKQILNTNSPRLL